MRLWQAKVDKSMSRIVFDGPVVYMINDYCIRLSRIHIRSDQDKWTIIAFYEQYSRKLTTIENSSDNRDFMYDSSVFQINNKPQLTPMTYMPPNLPHKRKIFPLSPKHTMTLDLWTHDVTHLTHIMHTRAFFRSSLAFETIKLSSPTRSYLHSHQFNICQRCLAVLAFRRTTVTSVRHTNCSFSAN